MGKGVGGGGFASTASDHTMRNVEDLFVNNFKGTLSMKSGISLYIFFKKSDGPEV